MKTSTKLALLGLFTAGVTAWTLTAQDAGNPPPNQERPPRNQDGPSPGGPDRAGGGQRPMMMPFIGALDVNHDGVIDADEIKNASAALLALDKNKDGKLTRDEFMGRPPGRQGQDGGPPPRDGQDRPDGQRNGPGGPDSKRGARFDDDGRPPFRGSPAYGDFRPQRDDYRSQRDFRGPQRDGFRPPRDDFSPGQPEGGMRPPMPKELVEKFDANKDGKLDETELGALLKDMREHRPSPLAGGPQMRPGGPGMRSGGPDMRPGGPPPEDGPPR